MAIERMLIETRQGDKTQGALLSGEEVYGILDSLRSRVNKLHSSLDEASARLALTNSEILPWTHRNLSEDIEYLTKTIIALNGTIAKISKVITWESD